MLGSSLLRMMRAMLSGAKTQAEPRGTEVVTDGLSAIRMVEDAMGCRTAGAEQALGMALGGVRATVLDDWPAEAGQHHAPLVAYTSSAPAAGVVWAPSTAQEAVDIALAARLVAELTLVPAAIWLPDALRHDVTSIRIADAETARALLGRGDDLIDAPTAAQNALFGAQRRRIPRLFDPDRPALHGATLGPEVAGLARAARDLYFGDPLPDAIRAALETVGGWSERPLQAVSSTGSGDLAVIASGPLAAIAAAAAERAGFTAITVRVLHPFPAADLAAAVGNRKAIVLDDGGTLALHTRASVPAAQAVVCPGPVSGGDLIALIQRAKAGRIPRWLGVQLVEEDARPKRQAVVDALRRAHPDIDALGVKGDAVDLRPTGAFTVQIHDGPAELGRQAARLLHTLLGGQVRAHTEVDPWDGARVCRITHAASSVPSPIGIDAELILVADDDLDITLASMLAALRTRGLADFEDRKALAARPSDAFTGAFTNALATPSLSTPSAAAPSQRVPLAVRHLGRADERHDSLTRFWNQVGTLYREHDRRLNADPHLAFGGVPPLASTFREVSGDTLPIIDPADCVGCGACWTACPEGAVGPVVIGSRSLLDTGMALATEAGHDMSPLKPVASKLAKRLTATMKDDEPPTAAGQAVERAIEAVTSGMPADRAEPTAQAGAHLAEAIATLPVARTQPFFDDLGKDAALLSLTIDPDACKRCGACVAACDAEALLSVAASEGILEASRSSRALWEKLPDTPGALVAHAASHADVGRLPALLLARTCLVDVLGGDPAEPGSGAKLAIRTALAAAEAALQPFQQTYLQELTTLHDGLDKAVRTELAQALPPGAEVADGLDDGLLSTLEASLESLDSARLTDLVDAARDIADLRERVSGSASGLDRARVGLALAPAEGVDWASRFPHNPFLVPTVVGQAVTPSLVLGLARSLAETASADTKRLQVAREALGQPTREPPPTTPLVFVAHEDTDLTGVLSSPLGIKVLVLCDADPGRPPAEVPALAQCHPRAYATQVSLAFPDHLAEALHAAFLHPGPALIRIHAPSPLRDGFASDQTLIQAAAAVNTRAFPLFRFDPLADETFGGCLDLAGNPDDAPNAVRATTWRTLQELSGDLTPPTPDVPEALPVQAPAADIATLKAAMAEQIRGRLLELAGYESGSA